LRHVEVTRKLTGTSSPWKPLWFFRLYFTLKKKAVTMSVTVSPCDVPLEWSLVARTIKDKPLKSMQCERAYTHTHTRPHTHTCTDGCTCKHTHTHAFVSLHACVCVHVCACTCTTSFIN